MENDWIIIRADDWEALFVNGKCVAENHKLNWPNLLISHNPPTKVSYFNIDDDWMENMGSFGLIRFSHIPEGCLTYIGSN